MSRAFIENRPDYREVTLDLTNNPKISFPVKFRSRYMIELKWKDASGTGQQVALEGSNISEGTTFPVLDPDTGAAIVLAMPGATGQDYIRNMVGHPDRNATLIFSGFTAGSVDISINFSL